MQVLHAKALLIDNDGVLVDSLSSIRLAFLQWGALHGIDGAAVYRNYGGRRSQDIARVLFGAEAGPAAALELDQLEIDQAPLVRALPGAQELLASMGDNWTLVTSGPRTLARARLAAAGLPSPRILVSADDVSAGKPSPESFLLAAELNETQPDRCVALEDSQFGVAAAVAAGCMTVTIGDRDLPGQILRASSLTALWVTGSIGQYVVSVGVGG